MIKNTLFIIIFIITLISTISYMYIDSNNKNFVKKNVKNIGLICDILFFTSIISMVTAMVLYKI